VLQPLGQNSDFCGLTPIVRPYSTSTLFGRRQSRSYQRPSRSPSAMRRRFPISRCAASHE
jgi:hypothetical protein